MRTTLNLPDKLVRRAQRVLGARTKTETIVTGLQQILRAKKIQSLLLLRGRLNLKLDLPKSRKRGR